jgi:hypothetical protein
VLVDIFPRHPIDAGWNADEASPKTFSAGETAYDNAIAH